MCSLCPGCVSLTMVKKGDGAEKKAENAPAEKKDGKKKGRWRLTGVVAVAGSD